MVVGFKPPLPQWITMRQMLNWLILGDRPLEDDLDRIRQNGREPDWKEWPKRTELFKEVRIDLLARFRYGALRGHGRISMQVIQMHPEWKTRDYENHAEEFSDIPAEAWTSIGTRWQRGSVATPDREYYGVRISREDFIRNFMPEEAENVPSAVDISYSTPYLDLMTGAIREFQITEDNQPKHAVLVEWFAKQRVRDQPVSVHQAKSLASFIRLPEKAIGGLQKMRSTRKRPSRPKS